MFSIDCYILFFYLCVYFCSILLTGRCAHFLSPLRAALGRETETVESLARTVGRPSYIYPSNRHTRLLMPPLDHRPSIGSELPHPKESPDEDDCCGRGGEGGGVGGGKRELEGARGSRRG